MAFFAWCARLFEVEKPLVESAALTRQRSATGMQLATHDIDDQ